MPESEPRLIRGYLEVLAAQLPGPIVEELADGLTETHRSYLARGLSPDPAAEAAVAEFGSAEEILAGLRPGEPGPASRPPAARARPGGGRLLGGGAGDQPGLARAVAGPGCAGPCAGFLHRVAGGGGAGRRYRVAFYSGVAGCVGFAALDASLIVGVLVVAGVASWVTAIAMAFSSARIAFCARAAVLSQQNT